MAPPRNCPSDATMSTEAAVPQSITMQPFFDETRWLAAVAAASRSIPTRSGWSVFTPRGKSEK